jgi:hypothetical protein
MHEMACPPDPTKVNCQNCRTGLTLDVITAVISVHHNDTKNTKKAARDFFVYLRVFVPSWFALDVDLAAS